jgi:creatinine amidohydrolase
MKDELEPFGEEAEAGDPDGSWHLDHLSWPEVGRILARDPRLIVPVGALVQHGPHLPLATNTFITEAVARELSRRRHVLLAPTFCYGVTGPRAESYAGSAGLRRKTLHRAMNELFAEWENQGIKEFLVLTAHRHESHLDALLMAMTSTARATVVNLLAIDTGHLLEGSPATEHGGELETSIMLYLAPSRVRASQVADLPHDHSTHRRYAGGRVPTPPAGSRGVLGYPSRASSEKGEAVFKRYVETLQEVLGPDRRTVENQVEVLEPEPGRSPDGLEPS